MMEEKDDGRKSGGQEQNFKNLFEKNEQNGGSFSGFGLSR